MIARRYRSRLLLACLGLIAFRATADAQVQVGASLARERVTYHFDAPSSYDTTDLVPHFFEQHYVLDNVWLDAAFTYGSRTRWRTQFAATPVRRAQATDYDTFFNPGNVVWVAGTTGDARVHSLRATQTVGLGRMGAIAWSGGYRFTLDVADFLDGTRTDTRNGVLTSSRVVTTAEHTHAQQHDLFFRGAHARPLGRRWHLDTVLEGSPARVARLAIQLPDKYPGQTLVYTAPAAAAGAQVAVTHENSAWPFSLYIEVGRSWRYRATQRAERTVVAAGVRFGPTSR